MAHEPEHEEILQQMLAGDLEPDARARVESCAECAPRWRELQALAGSIEDADRERREVLAESTDVRSAPGSDRVRATLEAERQKTFGSPPRARPTVSRRSLIFLAAAVLVAGFFVVRALAPEKSATPDTPLGTKIRFADDYKELSVGVPIRWQFGGDSDRVFFQVHLRGTGEHGQTLFQDIPVRDTEWTLDDGLLIGWKGGRVRLWVEAFDRPVNGESLGTSRVLTPTLTH